MVGSAGVNDEHAVWVDLGLQLPSAAGTRHWTVDLHDRLVLVSGSVVARVHPLNVVARRRNRPEEGDEVLTERTVVSTALVLTILPERALDVVSEVLEPVVPVVVVPSAHSATPQTDRSTSCSAEL